MPHWTLPRPAADDPIADAVNAIAALQTQVDALFATAITATAIETLSGHVTTFTKEFDEHVAEAKTRAGS
jgi:hypothetical protein